MGQLIVAGTGMTAQEADDQTTFNGIRDVGNITSTNQEIEVNPLFRLAENFIVRHIPDARLRTPAVAGKGRTYPERATVLSALELLTGSYLLRGGGSVGGESVTEGSGALKSVTERMAYVTITESYDVGSQSSRQSAGDVSDSDRAAWLEQQAFSLLELLGVNLSELSDEGSFVVQTKSTVKQYAYD